MFDKILIANRAEIAARVAQTARKMGVKTVAVYSDADAGARHVALADEAVHIGASPASESYLAIPKIIDAALKTGAQAIHPGYGFLSENPEFVEAVEAAGLVFIGPSAKAIRSMGLKDAAKQLMADAGVPVVPGTGECQQDLASLANAAADIGYPVLIKAVAGGGGKGMRLVEDAAGGGGKGMRLVDDAAGFADALTSAKNEAAAAFGNDDVLVEKYITNPRHIEFQIFGDGQNAVHLFERDCSLQRRHQKVIEEAPAPGMTPQMRAAMGDAAVRAAKAIGYQGAGTVEFIVDDSDGLCADKFWFMEMNTRLQVEHPVTEEITGIDLVEWQLRVASKEPLPCQQSDISIRGHAFEARIYAEDVPAGFLPATGRIAHLKFPPNVRADTGVRQDDEISPFYDPMIAKLTSHGPTRDIALSKLRDALAATELAGTTTNLGFLHALADLTAFRQAKLHTGLIAQHMEKLCRIAQPTPQDFAIAGLAALAPPLANASTGFALWQPLGHHIHLSCGDATHDVTVSFTGLNRAKVVVEATELSLSWSGTQVSIDGITTNTFRQDDQIWLFAKTDMCFEIANPLNASSDAGANENDIRAPMPGSIQAVNAKVGAAVKSGDVLLVLEAMKMEHKLTAPRDGTIEAVSVAQGDQIGQGDLMVRLSPEDI